MWPLQGCCSWEVRAPPLPGSAPGSKLLHDIFQPHVSNFVLLDLGRLTQIIQLLQSDAYCLQSSVCGACEATPAFIQACGEPDAGHLLHGAVQADQLDKIFTVLGHPSSSPWAGFESLHHWRDNTDDVRTRRSHHPPAPTLDSFITQQM